MEKKLFDAEKKIIKAKHYDKTVKVFFPGTNELFDSEQSLAYNGYIGGRIGYDIACTTGYGTRK
jgi:hypothetical protein